MAPCGVSWAMKATDETWEDPVKEKDWGFVSQSLFYLDPDNEIIQKTFDDRLNILLNTRTDLNTIGRDGTYLLTELLNQVQVSPPIDHRDRKKNEYIERALSELIKHEKLNPLVQDSSNGDSSYVLLYSDVAHQIWLRQIANREYDKKSASASIFHDKQAGCVHGIRYCKVTWKPQCLLVDYRFWLGLVGIASLIALYKTYNSKTEETEEDDTAARDSEQPI